MRAIVLWGSMIFGTTLWASAMAGGLGSVTVRSMLGQPLVADIELVVHDKLELEGLSARVASADAHRKANIPYAVTAVGLRANIQTGRYGRRFVRIESVQPITEPTVKLLIELTGSGSQTLREYNLLLEPPELRRQ
jgi:pilus assembly protein FimV